MARPAPIALCIALLLALVAFAAPSALADGKVFLSIAVDGAEAGSTMPRQRAIIAFKDGEQRMAIDTAFTGAGDEFAWLVPLPSEPEILPATKGMFDTVDLLTAPRVNSRMVPDIVIAPAALIIVTVLVMIWCKARGLWPVLVLFAILAFPFFAMPLLSGSVRGGPTLGHAEIHQQESVGLYDTVVLSADRADDVLAWLSEGGFAVPDGIESVVQEYLDRGWVFAAAKLRDEARDLSERRAHPLQFRFATEQAVYPMALTAIGNLPLSLDLYVFADGTANVDRLRRLAALEVTPRESDEDDGSRLSIPRQLTMPLSHPGLVKFSNNLPMVTRVSGTLSPEQQRRDIEISIGEPQPMRVTLRTPHSRNAFVLSSAVWLAVVPSIAWLIGAGAKRRSDGSLILGRDTPRWPLVVMILGTAIVGGAVVHRGIPVYEGATTRWFDSLSVETGLEGVAEFMTTQPIGSFGTSASEFTEQVEELLVEFDVSPQTGDSPLHYRIEFNEAETEAQFIWHDLIGAENRVVIPLVSDSTDDAPSP